MYISHRARKIAILVVATAVAGTALVTAATPARATTAFQITAANGPETVVVPTSTSTFKVTLTFCGDPASDTLGYHAYSSNDNQAEASYISGHVPASSASKPWLSDSPAVVVPGEPVVYTFGLDPSVTPGKYRLTLPVSQINSDADGQTIDRSATIDVAVDASTQPMVARGQ